MLDVLANLKANSSRFAPVILVLVLLAVLVALRLLNPPVLERLEWVAYDTRVRLAAEHVEGTATNLGFVAISDQAIKGVQEGALGRRFGLYWPRHIYGRLVDQLSKEGARAIGLDVLFAERRYDHAVFQMRSETGEFLESDEFFARELKAAGNCVLATSGGLLPDDLFLTNAMTLGDITTELDADGVLRRVTAFRTNRIWHPVFKKVEDDPAYGIDLRYARVEPSRIILRQATGDEVEIPLDEQGRFALADFIGDDLPAGWAPTALPFKTELVWHMGIVLAAKALGLDLSQAEFDRDRNRIVLKGNGIRREIPVDDQGRFYVNWRLPLNEKKGPLAVEDALSVLIRQRDGVIARTNGVPVWQDKLVVVGSSALGNDLTDRGATPLQSDTLLASKHWNVANSIITGEFVTRLGVTGETIIVCAGAVVVAILALTMRSLLALVFTVGLSSAYVWFCTWIFAQQRLWLPIALPLIAIVIVFVALTAWRVVFEQSERRRVKSVFSKVVSPNVVTELLQSEMLALGGARREITILFADVRGFTKLTDSNQQEAENYIREHGLSGPQAEACHDRQAQETLQTVNRYLSVVADKVKQHDGTLDKYIGDCVMAFWGAPTSNPTHALACVRAAVEAQREMDRLNQERAAQNKIIEAGNEKRVANGEAPAPLLPLLSLGTGINTGVATVGLMGSDAHILSYTVFGREVNLASRLEGVSGRGRVIISETTYQHLLRDDPELAGRCIAQTPVEVKGIQEAVKIYEVPWKQPANGETGG